jgi:hypothetical protein
MDSICDAIALRRFVTSISFGALIKASEKVCALRSRKTHALTIERARAEQQVFDFSGGERGTRTLDLGIMSATL